MSQRGRNLHLEHRLLAAAVATARRTLRIDCSSYPVRVRARLALGARRYGDTAFLDRDNLTELLEETPDVAGYALLELQRLNRRGLPDEIRDDLLRAMVMGAAADFYARRAQRRIRDGGGTR